MLKRWLSINKSNKKKTSTKNDMDDSTPSTSTMSDNHQISESVEPVSKPLPIKINEAKKNSSTYSNHHFSPPCFDKTSIDGYSGNATLQSLLSTSMDTALNLDSPGYLLTKVSEGLPYGDGSNKVFGYENFGNTCYCNSVLQCLYNLAEFRSQLLQYPERDLKVKRKRKSEMPGNKPRYFTESSFESTSTGNYYHESGSSGHHHHHHKNNNNTTTGTANANNSNDNTSSSSNNSNSSNNNNNHNNASNNNNNDHHLQGTNNSNAEKPAGLQRRNSSFLFNKHGNNGNTAKDTSGSHSNPFRTLHTAEGSNDSDIVRPVHATLIASDATSEKLHEGSRNVVVGRRLPHTRSDSNVHGVNHHHTPFAMAMSEPDSFEKSPDAENDTPNPAPSSSNSNQSSQSTFSSEQRKKAALMRGPVLNVDHLLNESEESNLYNGLKDIFESITENLSLTGVVSPFAFVDILKRENVLFNTMMHQDAHEFLNFLLNELSDYIQKDIDSSAISTKKHENFIKSLFQGTLTNRIKCLTCDTTTSRDEPFLDFPIEVKDDEETDIQAILQSYQQREMLSGSNKFYCNECCGLQEAERVVGLKQLPHTLALHLKRFKYSEEQNCNIKLFNKIHYPLILDVCSTFCPSVSKKYELTGIVVHMGGGPHHGHYVSLCKNDNFGWLLFDDETVESVNESTVLKFIGDAGSLTTAYVLFYKKLVPKITEEVADSLHGKKDYEKNIEQLIKCDDFIRLSSLKASNVSDEQVLEEGPVEVPVRVVEERKSSSSSTKLSRPKSRLFNFMRN